MKSSSTTDMATFPKIQDLLAYEEIMDIHQNNAHISEENVSTQHVEKSD